MQKYNHLSRAERHLTLAAKSFAAQRFQDCVREAGQARAIDDANRDAWYWLVLGQLSLGETAVAWQIADEAVEKFPDDARMRFIAAEVLLSLGHYEQAKKTIESAIAQDPSSWAGWTTYSAILHSLQDYHAAKIAAQRALELKAGDPRVLSNYANTLKETGEVPEAVKVLRKAIAQAPRSDLIRFNLLFTMLFDEDTTASALRHEAEQCAALLTPPGSSKRAYARPADSGRIRLGFLSNDLYSHACAYFILPLIANIDHSRFEVFVYSLNGMQDNITQKICHQADHFVEVAGLSIERVVSIIREAKLDVLFDTGGYTRNSPLRYMAHRLAVHQVTWLGYPGSTGMPQIDFRLTDSVADPEGYEDHYTEKLLRAPVVAAYYPLVGRPLDAYAAAYRTRATPALANGFITFGCCVNLAKISARTLRLWSGALARCAGSRLLVECAGLDNDAVRLPLLERMALAGIASDRVTCIPRRAGNQYVLYHEMDIVLDTSPMTGGTNICDALWMGVPVITLTGHAFRERLATSLVRSMGLDDLACDTEEQYVETAAALSADIGELTALRMSIRQLFEASPLFDAAGFSRWVEGQVAQWVGTYRQPGQLPRAAGDGMHFGGRWHSIEEITLSVVDALENGDIASLENLLENMSAKWSKHWLVAYALSEILHRQGDQAGALELLIEGATLRKYSLPLYRLLLARLDEGGHDKTALAEFLKEAFGLDVDYLERQPVPSIYEIAGISVHREGAVT